MKKTIMVILAILCLSVMAFASEVNDSDFNEQQIERTTIRLEQLDLSIQKHILSAETVMGALPENVSNESFVELVDDFVELRDDIGVVLENVSVYNATELDAEYELFKERAVNITTEFRALAQELIPDEVHDELREKVRNEKFAELEERKAQIREEIRLHNSEQVGRFLARFGLENESFVEQVRNGTMNVGQAISGLAKNYRGLGQMKRGDVEGDLNQTQVRAQIHKDDVDELVKQKRANGMGMGQGAGRR